MTLSGGPFESAYELIPYWDYRSHFFLLDRALTGLAKWPRDFPAPYAAPKAHAGSGSENH